MIEVGAATASDQVVVDFRLKLPGDVRTVHLLGDFNGWSPAAHALEQSASRGKSHTWEISLELPRNRIFQFCYELDGDRRIPDPDVPRRVPGPGGQQLSLLDTALPDPDAAGAPAPRRARSARERVQRVNVVSATRLEAEVHAAMVDPERRLQLAAELCQRARQARSPDERVRLLGHAIDLDPFELEYRLALGAALTDGGQPKAAADVLQRALALWPVAPAACLLLGQALLADGRPQEALEHLAQVPADGAMGRQAAFERAEAALRLAKGGADWDKVQDELAKLDVDADSVGLFCEKCLKIAVEANDPDRTVDLLGLAHRKLGAPLAGHPAYRLLEQVAMFEPQSVLANAAQLPVQQSGGASGPPAGDVDRLENLLKAYRLAQAVPAGDDGDRVKFVGAWQRLVERQGEAWPELKDAYLVQLDRWAEEAYKGKKFQLAGLLWNEAERIDPYNPAVLQNMALVYTRQDNEDGQRHYWDRLTRVLNLYCEMAPEAEGFSRLLVQKHQAFVEAAQKALPTATRWRDLLELAADWAREAVPLLALRQLEFRNPMFRCGIWRDDYRNKAERERLLTAAVTATRQWLELAAEWSGLPADRSELVQTRRIRLEHARQSATAASPDSRRHYNDERGAFKLHRDQAVHQYLMLLQVLKLLIKQLQEQGETLAEAELERYRTVARGVLAFPHELMKAGAMQLIPDFDPDIDMAAEACAVALFPWLTKGRELMEQQRPEAAGQCYQTACELAPAFMPAVFQLAQCLAMQKRWDEAWQAARQALALCKPDDEHYAMLANFVEQMDIARVQNRLEKVQRYLQNQQSEEAVIAALEVLDDHPEHPYVLFMLAQAYLSNTDFEEAWAALQRAAKTAKKDSELGQAIASFNLQINEYAPQMLLTKAVPLMKDEKWKPAAQILAKGAGLKPPSAQVTFYHAVCLGRAGDVSGAEARAREAMKQCRKPEDEELKGEIEAFIEQIPVMLIGEDVQKAQSQMERKNWRAALGFLDSAQTKAPKAAIVYFYRAVCKLNQDEHDEARRIAREGLTHAKGKANEEIRKQLNQVIAVVEQAEKQREMNRAVEAMNREDWYTAAGVLESIVSDEPFNDVAKFYLAVCLFRRSGGYMDYSTKSKIRELLADAKSSLFLDKELKKQIEMLEKVVG
ncbi:MAG TPA: tetratricopeptide repeat protein [Acidobacteriota bacterium]|nr:tetratricopeptide repeat protein [Acidobacteriota bacterium]